MGKNISIYKGSVEIMLTLQALLQERLSVEDLDQGTASYGPWSKSGLLSVFANKILLEHRHKLFFPCYLWLFSHCNNGVE